MLTCNICGLQVNWSLVSHITRKHKISCSEYKILYPETIIQIIKPETKKKAGATISNKYKTDEKYREKMQQIYKSKGFSSWSFEYWIKKGLTLEEAKEKIRSTHKVITNDTRKKLSNKCLKEKNPSSYESVMKRYNCSREEAKYHMPCYGRVGEKHPFYGKQQTEETKKKIANATAQNFKHNSSVGINRSNLEIYVFEKLRNMLGVNRVAAEIAINKYICDIVVDNKIIIEIFGDYWHCNPTIWRTTNYHNMLKLFAHEKWKIDCERICTFAKLGYKVVILWEQDIKSNRFDFQEVLNEIN